jgi:hypothetical protein
MARRFDPHLPAHLARPRSAADEPMRFRFILQPLMAAIVAIRDGLKDARTGRPPYFWTMLGNPRERTRRLNEGLNATARIILLGLVMDAIYQGIVLRRFYPGRRSWSHCCLRLSPT